MNALPACDLLVVGAGLCGLSVAWRAKAAGKRVALLEAAPRAGGVIRTERVGPYRVERAAAAFPSTAEHLLALVASLPTPPATREPPPEANVQFLLLRRGLAEVVRSPGGLVLSGVLPAGAALRAFAEVVRGPRHGGGPESLHAFVRRRFGAAVADRLLRPMTLGIYGSDPRDLGAADAFPALAAMEAEHGGVLRALAKRRGAAKRRLMTFEGGMESLVRALASALGDDLRLGTPVAALSRDGEAVVAVTAGGDVVTAREAVLATTAPDQARLVNSLSPAAAEVLAAVRYVPMVVASVGIPPGGSPPLPTAFGFLRGAGAGTRILGASFPSVLDTSSAPPGHALLTVFLGGGGDPGALDLDDDAVRETVERDLSRALRGPVRPDMVSIVRHARAIPVLSPGHRARMAAAQSLLSPFGVRLWGSHVSGVGVHACAVPLP